MNWDTGTNLPSPYVTAIEEIAAYFDKRPGVDALLLTGSWARGKGDIALGVAFTFQALKSAGSHHLLLDY